MMDLNNTSIEDVELVFLDVETTGLNPQEGDAVCEIAAIKIKGEQSLTTLQTFINPGRDIPKRASEIHHISNDDVERAPFFNEVVKRILGFFGNSILCGYNIGFDIKFLNNELKKINYPVLEFLCLDVLAMARRLFKLKKYNLSVLAEHLNITGYTPHRALDDACITKDIFLKAKSIMKSKGTIKTQDFIILYGLSSDFLEKNQQSKISLITESILKDQAMRLRYVSGEGNPQTVVIVPRKLAAGNGKRYLFGLNPENNDTITLSLGRILDAQIL